MSATLPKGWAYVDFDDAINVVSDRGFRIKQKDYLPEGKVRVIDQGEGLVGGFTDCIEATIKASPPVIVFGDHTRRFKYVEFPFAVGADGVKLFSPNGCWEPHFLFYQLSSAKLEDRGYGRHYQHLRKLAFVLPPRAEQTRIVEKLESLLADLDAGVAELKAAQRKLARYRQSLLKAAVEGALTAEWREANAPQETGAQLLARILRERRARFEQKHGPKKKYKEPAAPNTAQLPALPQGWVWATIDQLASVGTGVTPLRSNPAYFDGGTIPWTTSGALNEEIVISTSEHVTELAITECRLELFPPGSLLVAMYGEGKTRGKCAELTFASTINQAIAALVFEDSALAVRPYVKIFLLDAYEAMRKQASGGVQPNLNLQIIKALLVPLPPLAEQHQVLTHLDTALSACKAQESAVTHALKQAAAQRRNLLRAAFTGELVPQDPADEPASVLLERIRAARAAQGVVKKPRGRKKQEAV